MDFVQLPRCKAGFSAFQCRPNCKHFRSWRWIADPFHRSKWFHFGTPCTPRTPRGIQKSGARCKLTRRWIQELQIGELWCCIAVWRRAIGWPKTFLRLWQLWCSRNRLSLSEKSWHVLQWFACIFIVFANFLKFSLLFLVLSGSSQFLSSLSTVSSSTGKFQGSNIWQTWLKLGWAW